MRMFDVQGIEIMAPCRKVFDFVKQPANLPQWAHAFVLPPKIGLASRRPAERSMSACACRPTRRRAS
jgi:hypothetical protein